MNIFDQLKDLRNTVLDHFEDEIKNQQEISQDELEGVIEEHQEVGFNQAKSLINLLWNFHSPELKKLYRLLDEDVVSIEIKHTIKEAKEE